MDAIPSKTGASREREEGLAELPERDRLLGVGIVWPHELVRTSVDVPLDPPVNLLDVRDILSPDWSAISVRRGQSSFELLLRYAF